MKEIDQKLMRNEFFLEKGFDKILKIFAMLLSLVVVIVDRTMLLVNFTGQNMKQLKNVGCLGIYLNSNYDDENRFLY